MTRRTHPSHTAIKASACIITAIGMAMSIAASIDRGTTPTDKALIVVVSAAITASAHILPAVSRNLAGRILWAACLLVVVYGHASWLTASGHRAGIERAAHVTESAQAKALQRQLDALGARPLSTVSEALAAATARSARATAALNRCEASTPARCSTTRAAATAAYASVQALATELSIARRADEIRERLTSEAAQHDTRRASASTDPAAALVAVITGLPADHVQQVVMLITAVLVELLGALLWSHALLNHDHSTEFRTTSPAHHALDTASHAQQRPSSEPPSAHHWPAHAGRRVPSDTARSRPVDRLHRAGAGCDAMASIPASRPRPTGADGRQREGLPAQVGLPSDGMGRARPRAVDTG